MKYWWVNHKQTFSAEIEGGYIWSPKSNVNGGFNQTYLNLTQVKPGDVVFSYASGMIKAIGVATNSYREQLLPAAFGGATERWGEIGWEVLIQWKLLQVPISPKDHLQKFASLLPEKHSPIRADGNGNQGCYLASISDELGLLLMDMLRVGDTGAVYAAIAISEERQDQEAESIINQSDIAHTEKEQLIKARIGQGMFRINLEKIEKGCRVTGVTRKDLLIASHIKPWRDSDNAERIDGFNGLLLAPHVDKLFDRGWISFSDDGEILAVDAEIREILKSWGINPAKNIGRFSARQYSYLAYHRKNVFMRPDTSI
ncbi:MAG: HNH endonuclease [Chlorobiaceae bacterium]|nr:HNH endonuclease [Chlorobiaceae bacterium]